MRKKSTRLLSAALAACMMLSVLPVGAFAAEPGTEPENGASAQAEEEFVQPESVEINSTNFQDTDFQNYVKRYDKDGNDSLSLEERNKVATIELPDDSYCPTMKGIEYFPELVTLKCSNTHMRLLDVSKNLKLKTLWCNWNNLEQLDVSKNKALKDLRCGDNNLTTLNVSQNEALEWLSTNDMRSKLNSLDVSYNKALKHLECTKNGLTSLDVSSNEALELLVCDGNPLTELDVSKNDKLTSLSCRRCGLTSLKFGSAVSSMECDENQLTELDISQNTRWTDLRCNDNKLTSLSFNENVVMPPVASIYTSNNRYQIAVDADGIYDLSQLPGNFDVSKTSDWTNGERNGTELKVTPGSTTVTYKYNTGSAPYTGRRTFNLDVHWHNYRWKHDGTKHWRKCITANCPGLTDAQEAPHVYDNAKDNNCNTCGYVRPLYTVTTVNATAKLESEAEELKAPVAAGTEVILTAGNAPEGKTFAGWKLYNVSDTESEITDETELAKLLKNGIATTATLTLTMPAYNVKAEPYYSNIPYNITAVNCTVDKTKAAKGDTVTATRRKPEANEHFIDWTVKVNGVKQPDDFLTPDANDPAKVRFTMPAENVEIKANFEGNPTLNIGDHVTATIEGSDASVPSGSTVPVPKNKTVHLTATAPGQHFISWTVKVNGVEQDPTFLKPDADDPTKVTFTMPDANVEVTATFADDPIPEPDPVGPSDTGNIQGAISAVVIGAAAGAIIYEAGTGIYRVINMPGIPMPSNRIELAELLWEHAGKPEPVSTALYSDIDEGDTDAQKAARWAVEQDLMKDDADNNKFHPAFPVSKLRTCLTWNAAKEKGLFDKTEE